MLCWGLLGMNLWDCICIWPFPLYGIGYAMVFWWCNFLPVWRWGCSWAETRSWIIPGMHLGMPLSPVVQGAVLLLPHQSPPWVWCHGALSHYIFKTNQNISEIHQKSTASAPCVFSTPPPPVVLSIIGQNIWKNKITILTTPNFPNFCHPGLGEKQDCCSFPPPVHQSSSSSK